MTEAAAAAPLAQDEQSLREDLTKFDHLVAYFGWDEIIYKERPSAALAEWQILAS